MGYMGLPIAKIFIHCPTANAHFHCLCCYLFPLMLIRECIAAEEKMTLLWANHKRKWHPLWETILRTLKHHSNRSPRSQRLWNKDIVTDYAKSLTLSNKKYKWIVIIPSNWGLEAERARSCLMNKYKTTSVQRHQEFRINSIKLYQIF